MPKSVLAERLRGLRESKDYSMSEVARRATAHAQRARLNVKVDPGMVSRIESGETPNPRRHTLMAIAGVFSVSPSFLLGLDEVALNEKMAEEIGDDRHLKSIVRIYTTKLDPGKREFLYQFTRLLAKQE